MIAISDGEKKKVANIIFNSNRLKNFGQDEDSIKLQSMS